MYLTSKLFTCFTDGFTSEEKSQLIDYLLIGRAHIYIILDLEGDVHSIWDLEPSGLQECKDIVFSKLGGAGRAAVFGRVKNI